jgi:hypothetical protein
VAVDLPELHGVVVCAQSPVPGDRVLVVGVDERAIDVEDDGGRLGGGHDEELPGLDCFPTG